MKMTWWKAWILQCITMLVICLLAELGYYLSGTLHSILAWAILPLTGAYTACKAVLHGLNNYLAWIAPPACIVAAGLLLWGYVPHGGPVLLCAFVSLVGAAAGEVLSKDNSRHKH